MGKNAYRRKACSRSASTANHFCCTIIPVMSTINFSSYTTHHYFPHNRARTATPSRTMAVESRAHLHKDIPKNWDQLKNNIWLSDAGAYPVLVVLTFACGMCGGYMAYTGMKNQDVRWSFSKRQQLIRTWE